MFPLTVTPLKTAWHSCSCCSTQLGANSISVEGVCFRGNVPEQYKIPYFIHFFFDLRIVRYTPNQRDILLTALGKG
jgi:hypothetical protein